MAQTNLKPKEDSKQTLSSLMGKRLYGWALVEGYYLRYDHGLMSFTPVVRGDTGEIVVCLTKEVADEVRQLLDTDRRHKVKIESRIFLTNGFIGYFVVDSLKGNAETVNVVNHHDVEYRCANSVEPYRIAPM